MVHSYISSVRIISPPPVQSRCRDDRPWAYNTYYTVHVVTRTTETFNVLAANVTERMMNFTCICYCYSG